MGKVYNEVDSLKVVKDLLNLMINDTKRFATLKNKFKKSVSNFKTDKDGKIIEVQFNAVSNSVINEEIAAAITSLEVYCNRSAKKAAEFKAIVDLESVVPNTKTPKNVKVAKALDGKIKKVAKDSSLPKEKEPKEVKKVKNKNEPVKKPVKAAAKKTSTKVVSGTKANKEPKEKVTNLSPEDQLISDFISSLDGTTITELILDILGAFAGDAKLNTTMNNWVDKTKDDKEAAIGMLTSAYKRKPNNSKLKDTWYKKLKEFGDKKLVDKEAPKEEVKTKTAKVPEADAKVNEVPAEAKEETKEEPEGKLLKIYTGLLSDKLIVTPVKCSFRINTPLLMEIYGGLKEAEAKISTIEIYDTEIEKYVKQYLDEVSIYKNKNELLSLEASSLEASVASGYKHRTIFNQICIINLINMMNSSAGIDTKLRSTLLGTYKNLEGYRKGSLEQSQLENYMGNREIVTYLLTRMLEIGNNDDLYLKIFNVIGEMIINFIVKPKEEVKKEAATTDIKYSITSTEISFMFDNTSFIIQKLDPNYAAIYDAVIKQDFEKLRSLVITDKTLKDNIKEFVVTTSDEEGDEISDDEIKIMDKKIFYKGRVFKGRISSELMAHIASNNKEQISKFKKFIHNCSLNPSHESVSELYDFMVLNNLKVTPAGTIILYKWVRDSYYDSHSGKFLNKPGLTLFMDRNKVNTDRNQTCSNGLHLCSYKYGSFGSKLLLCEVHPKNVVSIPSDCNRSKMRCCEYTVLLDITEYVDIMNKTTDFILKSNDLHYNSKLLEIELMKLYPDVIRRNSTNGLNGCEKKSEKELLSMVFNSNCSTIEEIKSQDLKEDNETDRINISEADCETFMADEIKEEAAEIIGGVEVPEKMEDKSEVIEEVIEKANAEEEAEAKYEIIPFKEYFDRCLLKESNDFGDLIMDFELEDAEKFINAKINYDTVVMAKVFLILGLEFTNYKAKVKDEVYVWIKSYIDILKDEISSTQFERDHLKEKTDIAETVENNIDEVKVVERIVKEEEIKPSMEKEDGLIGKAKSFFKKLF